jgi:hypothetical protein
MKAKQLATTTSPPLSQALRASLRLTQSLVDLAELQGTRRLSSINREVSLIQIGEALDAIHEWYRAQPRAED